MSVVQTRQAEYVILEAALPGHAPEAIGVLLHDPESGEAGVRLRRDWNAWMDEDAAEVFEALGGDLDLRVRERGAADVLGWMEDTLSHTLRISERQSVLMDRFDRTLERVYRRHVAARVMPYRTHLPVYSCRAAAGRWGEQREVEAEEWMEAPEGLRLDEGMFVAQVVGRSMEPEIPDGSWCVFRGGVAGSRQGKKLLVENFGESEQGGQRYTVKRYRSRKEAGAQDGEWRHARIVLEPLNPEFEAWELEEGSQCRVIGELVRVLD